MKRGDWVEQIMKARAITDVKFARRIFREEIRPVLDAAQRYDTDVLAPPEDLAFFGDLAPRKSPTLRDLIQVALLRDDLSVRIHGGKIAFERTFRPGPKIFSIKKLTAELVDNHWRFADAGGSGTRISEPAFMLPVGAARDTPASSSPTPTHGTHKNEQLGVDNDPRSK